MGLFFVYLSLITKQITQTILYETYQQSYGKSL